MGGGLLHDLVHLSKTAARQPLPPSGPKDTKPALSNLSLSQGQMSNPWKRKEVLKKKKKRKEGGLVFATL